MKELIGRHISTILGLILISLGSLHLFKVVMDQSELDLMLTGISLAGGLFLIITPDRYIKSVLNKFISKKSGNEE